MQAVRGGNQAATRAGGATVHELILKGCKVGFIYLILQVLAGAAVAGAAVGVVAGGAVVGDF